MQVESELTAETRHGDTIGTFNRDNHSVSGDGGEESREDGVKVHFVDVFEYKGRLRGNWVSKEKIERLKVVEN
jgi:hypothetical protein